MSLMESSSGVSRVPTTSVLLSVPRYLTEQVEAWADRHGVSRANAAEILLAAGLAADDDTSLALRLRRAYESGTVQTVTDVSNALDAAGIDIPVIGFQLGPRQPVRDIDEPFHRDHLGADLGDDALAAWPSTRGVWRVSDRPRIVVALRLGQPLAIYRVAGWDSLPETPNRRWATSGTIISGHRRINADTGEDLGDTTETERTLSAIIMAKPLLQPASANPLIWLHRR